MSAWMLCLRFWVTGSDRDLWQCFRFIDKGVLIGFKRILESRNRRMIIHLTHRCIKSGLDIDAKYYTRHSVKSEMSHSSYPNPSQMVFTCSSNFIGNVKMWKVGIIDWNLMTLLEQYASKTMIWRSNFWIVLCLLMNSATCSHWTIEKCQMWSVSDANGLSDYLVKHWLAGSIPWTPRQIESPSSEADAKSRENSTRIKQLSQISFCNADVIGRSFDFEIIICIDYTLLLREDIAYMIVHGIVISVEIVPT